MLVYPWPPFLRAPDPGVDASDATSFLPRRRHRSLFAALASAPRSPSSPARPIHRPRSERGQIGRVASREVSPVPFSVHWSRRTVRSYHASDHPASAFVQPRHPRQGVSSPMRFFCASRLRCLHFRALETPPARVIRAWCSSDSARSGPAPGLVLAAWPVARSSHRARAGDVRGICSSPFAVLVRPLFTGERAFYRCVALGPTCRLAFAVHREFHRSRDPVVMPGRWAVSVAASGFWPRGPALAT